MSEYFILTGDPMRLHNYDGPHEFHDAWAIMCRLCDQWAAPEVVRTTVLTSPNSFGRFELVKDDNGDVIDGAGIHARKAYVVNKHTMEYSDE